MGKSFARGMALLFPYNNCLDHDSKLISNIHSTNHRKKNKSKTVHIQQRTTITHT